MSSFLFVIPYAVSWRCWLWVSFVLLQTASASQNDNCSFYPVHIPVKDVSFPNGGYMRGASLSVGNPPQEFALSPSAQIQNMWLYNSSGFCPDTYTEVACVTDRGGLFLEQDSVTFQDAASGADAGAPVGEWQFKAKHWGTDDVMFNQTSKYSQYPFGLPGIDLQPISSVGTRGNALGLGQNSTILSLLRKAGNIGSRSWSLWWGLMGVEGDARMDGGLVLGGYDKAKIRGSSDSNYTGELGDFLGACPTGMLVTITGMTLHFPNGSEPNLVDPISGVPIQTCISPDSEHFMSMPFDPYYDWFEKLIGSTAVDRSQSLNFWTMLFRPEDAFTGDISVTIDNDWTVRIPNSQLVMPYQVIEDDGHIQNLPAQSDLMILSLIGRNGGDIPRLGRYFLTAAHLFVNQDDGTFTLWEAEPTTDTDLISVLNDDISSECGPSTVEVGPVPTNTSSPNSGDGGSQDPQASESHGDSKSTNVPALVGGILGGSLMIALLIIVFGVFLRRHRGDQSWKALILPRRKEPEVVDEHNSGPMNKALPFLQEPAPVAQELWGQYYPKSRPGSKDTQPRDQPQEPPQELE